MPMACSIIFATVEVGPRCRPRMTVTMSADNEFDQRSGQDPGCPVEEIKRNKGQVSEPPPGIQDADQRRGQQRARKCAVKE